MNKEPLKVNVSVMTCLLSMLALASCGQAPSFVDSATGGLTNSGGGGGSASGGSDGTAGGGGSNGANGGADGTVDPSNPDGTAGGGGSNPDGSGGGTDHTIPGANPGDVAALQRCLANWKNNPFPATITNYKRIFAAISVGSNQVVIDDKAQSETPQLILIDAGVNVGGSPIYNLKNQNGYYCMKVGVNVNTSLIVNLACNARLADSRLQVKVNSAGSGNDAGIGVNVGSQVTVRTVDQNGQTTCH